MVTERITSVDVARKAGVSQSAVSRVFTPGASASQKTVDKVRKAALELGYRPNVLARSLITGRSRIIGLVVAYLNNQFYPEALEKLSNRLQREGYHVLIFMANNTQGDIGNVIEEILDYQVDGIVAASVAMSSDLAARCQAVGVPVVLFNRRGADDELSSVTADNIDGGRQIAEHLLGLGHRQIGFIAGWEGASTQLDREAGFLDRLDEDGVSISHRESGNYDIEQAKEATRRMFASASPPTAVFVANDHMAFPVMDVLRFELGLKIPQDVSVIGFDDVPLAAYPAYDLTTMRQPANRMVDATVDLLMGHIDHPSAAKNRSTRIEASLVKRGSTAKPKEA